MRIIPAIDIIGGRCVRLTKGDYATEKVYNEDPLEVAKAFEAHGIKHLHLVDLDGARSEGIANLAVLERLASQTGLEIDFGGGIKSDTDVRAAFNAGARQVTAGSIAVKERETFLNWLREFGPDRMVLGADARDGFIAISGWQEESSEELIPFVNFYRTKGVRYVICTDISKDGMLMGPATDLYRKLIQETMVNETKYDMSGVHDMLVPGISLIASGGITHMKDLEILEAIGCEGAILGKAIYENSISRKELADYISK